MLPVSSIIIIVKALSSPFNINFRNCCGVSASSDYKRIRLRNKSQRGVFTKKGYLAGELLCSLVSAGFQTLQMDGIPPRLKHSEETRYPVKNKSGTFLYICIKALLSTKVWFWFLWCVRLLYVSQGEVNQMSLAEMQTIWYLAKN